MTDYGLTELAYDTPAHDAAQAKCMCIFNHAINATTRRAVHEAIDNARRTDMSGFELAMVQLTQECKHKLAPNTRFQELVTSFEDEELFPDYDLEHLLRLVNGAEEAEYFAPLDVSVKLYVQTIDGGPYPILTIAV